MKKQTKRTMIKVVFILTTISVILICTQYMFMKMHTGEKDIELSKEDTLASTESENNTEKPDQNEGEYLRLNKVEYRKESNTAYRQITVDKTMDGAKIAIKREGAYYQFDNGIFAHANSNVYYNLEEYNNKYHYLTMYVGLNQTCTGGDGVKFWIYTSSKDTFYASGSNNWELKKEVDCLPGQEAEFVKIDITGAKYLRLQAYQKGGNGQDHSVYVDPMLITDKYEEVKSEVPTVEEYEEKIKQYSNKDLSDPGYELLILQRKFISNVGNYALQRIIEEDPDNQATIDWLMNDLENLRYYILGGTPTGGYYNSIKVLTKLLKEYKSDFDIQEKISAKGQTAMQQRNLNMPDTKGNLYKRMAITLSLTHSTAVNLWMNNGPSNRSDACVRYQQYKYMYNNGNFKATDVVDITPWFETYTIEEMRYVMNTALDDEEMIWLNEYTQSKIDANPNSAWGLLTPHSYMAYVWPNYANPVYYAEENFDYFNDLFGVPQKDENGSIIKDDAGNVVKKLLWPDPKNPNAPTYNITRGTEDNKVYKLWMNFRNKFNTGAVCGGISKTGHCIRGSHAIASAVIGQPGHAAIIYYTRNSNNQGYWGIDNDVSGWAYSEKGERMPLGWGNDRTYVQGYNIPYIAQAQEALNDFNNLQKAEELLMTVDLCDTNKEKETVYNNAINTQSINLDAWAGLVKLYLEDETKTEQDYYNLAKRMMDNLKYFPYGMYNLSNKIKTKFTTDEYVFKYSLLETKMLNEAKNYPDANSKVLQPGLTRLLAANILGQLDTSLAKFSFDGTDAGKIILGNRFDGSVVRWEYSLDGRKTWTEVYSLADDHKHTLTQTEINSITSENDIYIHIVGVRDYSDENVYKIDIQESKGLPANTFANDNENRIIGVDLSTEWRYTENDSWTAYRITSPDLTGDKTVQLRQGATGTFLASKNIQTYTFNKNDDPDTRKYVPVSHLSIQSVSTQATNNGGAAVNAIDANYNTRYHSAWNGTDTQRFMVIKLDEPMYISAVEFVPAGGGNGKIYDGTIYGSMTAEDDNSWKQLTKQTNLTYKNKADTIEQAIENIKSFEIEEPQKVQYIKIVADRTNGNWFTARAFNFFEDLTKKPVTVTPTASIAYSTNEKTNEPVIARLVNPSTEITIVNNEGKDSYVFTKNGEFTFEFVDKDNNRGSATAKVDWIDSKSPTADIDYELSDDLRLKAILNNISEDVYILDTNNNKTNFIEVDENGVVQTVSYLDSEGNTYKTAEVDETRFTTKMTYLNTTKKVERIKYYVTAFEKTIDPETSHPKITTTRLCYDADGNVVEFSSLSDEEKAILVTLEDSRSNPLEIFLENGEEYKFKLLDTANNTTYKEIRIDFIESDSKILASDITYSTTMLTNQNVVATINPYVIDLKDNKYKVEVVEKKATENEEEQYEVVTDNKHTFEQNGEYTFSYRRVREKDEDESLDMEVKTHTAKVDWIDKVAPTATITYSTKEDAEEITVTLGNESEDIIITNNGSDRKYTFKENGEFTFEFQDKAGNKGTATAVVDWMTKEPEELALGDVNGNGLIDIDDLAKVKLHFIGIEKLTDRQFKAGDVDKDNEITVNDIAQIKLAILGVKTLE